MRKVLIIALGLASLGAIASVQPAAAALGSCKLAATDNAYTCTWNPMTGRRVCVFSQTRYDTPITIALQPKPPQSANPKP